MTNVSHGMRRVLVGISSREADEEGNTRNFGSSRLPAELDAFHTSYGMGVMVFPTATPQHRWR